MHKANKINNLSRLNKIGSTQKHRQFQKFAYDNIFCNVTKATATVNEICKNKHKSLL